MVLAKKWSREGDVETAARRVVREGWGRAQGPRVREVRVGEVVIRVVREGTEAGVMKL